jgi:ubiquinone biosynthesis protein
VNVVVHRDHDRGTSDVGPPHGFDEPGSPRTAALIRRAWAMTAVVARHATTVGWHATSARLRGHTVDETNAFPRQIRLALEELGPTFVKLGQLLSARSDVVSPRLQHELAMLRDHAPTMRRTTVVAALERSLGSAPTEHFETFEIVPVACASIGQVHRATLRDGRRVAVKLRRPAVRAQIDTDVSLLRIVLQFAMRVSRTARTYDPVALLDEFAAMLRAETDYRLEVENIEVVRRGFPDDDVIAIPKVMTELSSESLLVMDWIDGIPLTRADELDAAGINRPAVARAIMHAYAQMMFQSERFHADPHPGNLIAQPDKRLGLVDFGEVGSIDADMRNALIRLLVAVLGRNSDALGQAVLDVSHSTRRVDRGQLGDALAALLAPITDATLQDIRLGAVLRDLLHVLRRNGLVLPADLAVLLKTVIECEGTTNEIDPAFSMTNFLTELGKRVGFVSEDRGRSVP